MPKENQIILYSLPSCCMCASIKERLKAEGVLFTQAESESACRENNISTVPTLSVNGVLYQGGAIIQWIKEAGRNE